MKNHANAFYFFLLIALSLIRTTNGEETNVARGKQVRQSCNSTSETRCSPAVAVDGNMDTYTIAYYNPNESPIIFNAQGAWLQVDLEEIYSIAKVIIYVQQKVTRITINIYSSNNNSTFNQLGILYDQEISSYQFVNLSVSEDSINEGRYVTIKSAYSVFPIPIRELEISSVKGYKVAQYINPIQSSTLASWDANKAVDGNLVTCSSTLNMPSWWSVDLGNNYDLSKICINNKNNNQNDINNKIANIFISLNKSDNGLFCNNFTYNSLQLMNIICLRIITGRYVKINNPNENFYFILCEVVVYALPKTQNTIIFTQPTTPIRTLAHNGSSVEKLTKNDLQLRNNIIIGVIVGFGLFLILLIAIILVYLLCYKRKHNKKSTSKNPCQSIISNSELSGIDTKRSIIDIDELDEYVKNMYNVGYSDEFKDLPNENILSTEIASKSSNIRKNRFKNILPFDNNIVRLKVNEYKKDDYINASFIQGHPEVTEKYIACQAPKKETVRDHWKMILDHRVFITVMLTPLVESSKKKSEQYWPDKKDTSVSYKDVSVTLLDQQTFSDFTCREMTVTCKSDPEITQHVKHLQFTSWKDKSVPVHTYPLLAFMRRVRKLASISNAPILAHCSAGVGRTGSYLAIENLIEQARMEKQVSVFECVKKLRHQRMFMVQTEEQYRFVHDAILDAVLHGNSGHDNESFLRLFPNSQTMNVDAKFAALERLRQFDRPSVGNSSQNETKNRNKNIYAYDNSMIGLPSTYSNNEYINAAVCDSYFMKNSCILTQIPLPTTLEDFWNMILEQRIKTIILLDSITDDKKSPSFLPQSSGEMSIGSHVLVDQPTEQQDEEVKIQVIRANSSNSDIGNVIIYSLHHEVWPAETYVPRSTSFIIQLHKLIKNKRERLVFQCLDGSTRSGLVASAFHLLDRIKSEQIVDPLLAARYTIHCRPQAVINKDQFFFLYQVAYDYLIKNVDQSLYANIAYATFPQPNNGNQRVVADGAESSSTIAS